jgi:hypothetical protein
LAIFDPFSVIFVDFFLLFKASDERVRGHSFFGERGPGSPPLNFDLFRTKFMIAMLRSGSGIEGESHIIMELVMGPKISCLDSRALHGLVGL